MPVTLQIIKSRCAEDGDCWIWQQSLNSMGYPQMCANGKPGQMVRRLAVQLSGRVLKPGYRVVSICAGTKCCNPDHLRLWTSGMVMERAYESGKRSTQAEYLKRRQHAVQQGITKLNMELARAIRADEGTHLEVARRLGVHKKTVYEVRRGNTWREAAPNSSVFAQSA